MKFLIVGVFIVISSYMALPRGIRNNNPGNIKKTNDNWVGMSPIQSDDTFVKFTHPKYGVRAMAKIIKTYRARNVVYLVDIISEWAPATENDVGAYVSNIEKITGIYGNQVIYDNMIADLLKGIIRVENGFNPYPDNLIKEGVSLA